MADDGRVIQSRQFYRNSCKLQKLVPGLSKLGIVTVTAYLISESLLCCSAAPSHGDGVVQSLIRSGRYHERLGEVVET